MAKIDEIKELIGFLKLLFATFVAIDVSLIAWFVKSHETNESYLNIGTLILIIVFALAIVIDVKAIMKKIRYLKDL